jgi:hypothetical protein
MIIDIPKLPPDGARFAGEEPPDLLDLEPSSGIEARSPITYDLFAQVVTGELLVQGRVRAELTQFCGWCGDLFSTIVEDSSFLCTYPLRDHTLEVDVSPDLRERILLRLPMVARCSESCRGVCPQCGANRNLEDCDCRPVPFSPIALALDGLKLDENIVPPEDGKGRARAVRKTDG